MISQIFLDEIDALEAGMKFFQEFKLSSRNDIIIYPDNNDGPAIPRVRTWALICRTTDRLRAAFIITRDGLNRTQISFVNNEIR